MSFSTTLKRHRLEVTINYLNILLFHLFYFQKGLVQLQLVNLFNAFESHGITRLESKDHIYTHSWFRILVQLNKTTASSLKYWHASLNQIMSFSTTLKRHCLEVSINYLNILLFHLFYFQKGLVQLQLVNLFNAFESHGITRLESKDHIYT